MKHAMPEHKHLHWFEHHHHLLRLVCHYVVDVDGPEIHSRNAMPWSRLFLIGSHSPCRSSRVTDIAGRGRERSIALAPGAVVFMPPGRLLGFDFTAQMRMLAFHFRLELAPGQDVFAGRSACAARHDRAHLVDAAYAAVRGPHHLGTVTSLRGLLLTLAADFLDGDLEEVRRRQSGRRRFAEALDHIEANCRADLRVADLAELMGLGREHFTRQFRRDHGQSPKDYLAERLLERACARLLAGERVGDVATALGFASPFYFSRFFKGRTGVSPRAFSQQQLFASP
jgi:AraC-like DNA-binding protein